MSRVLSARDPGHPDLLAQPLNAEARSKIDLARIPVVQRPDGREFLCSR